MSRSRKKNHYRESRRFDRTCRCHGGCPWCLRDRKHAEEVRKAAADEQVVEFDFTQDVNRCPLCGTLVYDDLIDHLRNRHEIVVFGFPHWHCPCGWFAENAFDGPTRREQQLLEQHILSDPDHFRAALVERALLTLGGKKQ